MSDSYITLIPTEPDYVPAAKAQEAARELLESFVPEADEVTIRVNDKFIFEHPGENWSGVSCPICGSDINEWFEDLLDHVEKDHPEGDLEFSDLATVTPCCGSSISLNDLDFKWPAGFSLFALDALNPNIDDLTPAQVQDLEDILGCKLRRIWEHI